MNSYYIFSPRIITKLQIQVFQHVFQDKQQIIEFYFWAMILL